MIRRRDHVRLSLQKLGLRKKRAAFSILSIALGVIVVVTVDSLLQGVRDVALKTLWTEELENGVIKVYSMDNPYEVDFEGEAKKSKTKRRHQFLNEAAFDEMRAWSEVAAADRPVNVQAVHIDAFTNRLWGAISLRGVPEALLRRHVTDAKQLESSTHAIPMVVGERNLRLQYDPKKQRLTADADYKPEDWIGREVTILLGDNYAMLPRYQYDHEKKSYRATTEEELAGQREAMQRSQRLQYDMTIFNTTLSLRGRVVATCPGYEILVPLDTAAMCEKWMEQRNRLASLHATRSIQETDMYEYMGRRFPKAGEYTEGLVVVKNDGDTETIAKRIEEMGFSVATRERAFESQAKAFDSGLRIVKYVAFAFGGVILAFACGLLWSTTSKIVSDSRADIGLFRALGATKRDIRRLFLGESVLLGVLGTMVGMLVGWLVAAGISHWVVSYAQSETEDPESSLLVPDSIFQIDWSFCLWLLAGAIVVSVLSGLWPANRAAKIDPVMALKRE